MMFVYDSIDPDVGKWLRRTTRTRSSRKTITNG